jgi:rhodanese-related sulfurtransferase
MKLLHRIALAGGVALLVSACVKPTASVLEKRQVVKQEKPAAAAVRGKVTSMPLDVFFPIHQQGKLLVFDARPGFLYQISHIPGALHLSKGGCDEWIDTHRALLDQAVKDGKTIVVYCSGLMCPDARTVASHLATFGYSASVLSGGWNDWTEAGMPTE